MRKLKRGKYLYLDNESWYQELQGIKVERETSPPDSSQDSPEPEGQIPKKRKWVGDKFDFLKECRCLYRQSKTLVKQTRTEVNCEMNAYKDKNPDKPNFYRRN